VWGTQTDDLINLLLFLESRLKAEKRVESSFNVPHFNVFLHFMVGFDDVFNNAVSNSDYTVSYYGIINV
jgi:hypothetical protein